MIRTRITGLAILLSAFIPSLSHGQVKTPGISEKAFRHASLKFFDDPLDKEAKEAAKIIVAFATRTKRAEVMIGKREIGWLGKDKNKGFLLLTAYIAGNTQAQLDSGIRGDDTYAGLLKLFRIYRAIKDQHKKYKNKAVEKLLKMQKEGKLLQHVIKLNKERAEELKNKKKLETRQTPEFSPSYPSFQGSALERMLHGSAVRETARARAIARRRTAFH